VMELSVCFRTRWHRRSTVCTRRQMSGILARFYFFPFLRYLLI